MTAFSAQGKLNKFIENKATKRKEHLNRFLELDVFDKLYVLARDDYAKLNNQNDRYSIEEWTRNIEKTRQTIAKIEAEMESHETRQTSLSEKRDKLNVWVKTHEQDAAEVEVASFDNLKLLFL